MATTAPEPARRRRRGPELESALLDAAWDELTDVGFANMTMESVAARAHTGIAVLYRRWDNKDQLALAALEHYRRAHPVDVPDTGSLRGDLIGVLTVMSRARSSFWAIAAATAFSGLLADTGLTPAQARDKVLGEDRQRTGGTRGLARASVVYQRAHDRDEIDLDRIPRAVLTMPFDLVRHDMLMDLKALKPNRIRSIVDDLVMPLIEHYHGVTDEAATR